VRATRPTVTTLSASERASTKLHGVRLSFDASVGAGTVVRLEAAGARGQLAGYGAIFGTTNRRGYKLISGAFSRSRHGMPLAMLWRHAEPIGCWHQVQQDARGLFVSGELNLDTELGRRALAHVQHGDTTFLSVGFSIGASDDAVVERDGVVEIRDADLAEVSIVPAPAEPEARIDSVR
jgi:HK97 family phage prohead protease